MKIIRGLVNGIPVKFNVPESYEEFRNGARFSKGSLEPNEGYLFNFRRCGKLTFENSGVEYDLTLLFFHQLSQAGVSYEVKHLERMSPKEVSSDSFHSVAIELRSDFCRDNGIGLGAIVSLKEPIE